MRLLVMLVLVCLVLAVAASGGEREDLVLAWDDDDTPRALYTYPAEGRQIAVMFQAPEGFTWLKAIRCYMCNDNVQDPQDPWAPTTQPCMLSVWVPQEVGEDLIPGPVPAYEFNSGSGYPEEAWIEFILPEAVDLSDSATFPDRVFFVGVKWLTMGNPALGVDWDPIVSGNTWQRWISPDWARFPEHSASIRAVVSDTSGSAVELVSWGVIKSGYRAP